MASEIELVVTGTDKSGPAIQSARKNAQKLADDTGAIGDAAQKSSRGVTTLGESFQRMGEIAGGTLAADVILDIGTAAGQFAVNTVRQASNLEESIQAVNVVFGESAKQINEWGETNAVSFGLSRQAFNTAIIPIASMLKNLGFSMTEVTTNSIELTKRAADMASVFNVDVQTALDAIAAALRGEADPIERFGVSVNAAAVEAKGLAQTGKEAASALTDQEKAAARLSIIMEQTAQVQGNFADNSDKAANASRIARAAFEETQAQLGEFFLPVLANLAKAATGILEVFNKLPDPVQNVTGMIALFGAAALIAVPRIAAMASAINGFIVASGGARAALGGLTAMLAGPWGLALGAGIALLSAFSFTTKEAKIETDGLRQTLDEQTGAITDATREWVANRLIKDDIFTQAKELGISEGLLTDAILGQQQAINEVNLILDEHRQRTAEARAENDDFSSSYSGVEVGAALAATEIDSFEGLLKDYQGTIGDAQEEQQQFTEATQGTTDAVDAATQALERETQAMQDQADQIRAQTDPIFALIDATDNFTEAQERETEAINKYGAESDEAEEATRDLMEAAFDLLDAQSKAGAGFNGELTPALENTLKEMGFTDDQIKRLERSMDRARGAFEDWEDVYKSTVVTEYQEIGPRPGYSVPGGSADIFFYRSGGVHGGGNIGVQQAQGGGPRSNLSLVGEDGPELVRLPFGSQVIPSGQTRTLRRQITEQGGVSGRPDPLRIVVDTAPGMERSLTDALLRALSFRVRTEGGDVQRVIGGLIA